MYYNVAEVLCQVKNKIYFHLIEVMLEGLSRSHFIREKLIAFGARAEIVFGVIESAIIAMRAIRG
tara:strand:- start:4 stop:198 length:195 start_codon:yes stop_codon:yes gene_type:complete